MEVEDDGNLVSNDPIDPSSSQFGRLRNLLKANSAKRWLLCEFGDFEDSSSKLDYDLGSFMEEYYPQLKTRFLPRRGWQLIRRSLGKARRFSSAFIERELKEMRVSPICEPEQYNANFVHSNKLLESIVSVKKLLALKKKTLLEIALKNEEIAAIEDSRTWSTSYQRDTKAMFQRCLSTLYRVNEDIVAPMTVLHEHLLQCRNQDMEKETSVPTAIEIYIKCFNKAELDLQVALRNKSVTSFDRDLVHALQTILYVTGELGGPNSAELLGILDKLFSDLLESLPPDLCAQLKQTMEVLEPCRKRINEFFKIVPKEEPKEDI
ncbi:hypothetical protein KR200_009610 [Drosophila serrata]|nr:hypothetical protein KR200_009610 [Drosophila serrata]